MTRGCVNLLTVADWVPWLPSEFFFFFFLLFFFSTAATPSPGPVSAPLPGESVDGATNCAVDWARGSFTATVFTTEDHSRCLVSVSRAPEVSFVAAGQSLSSRLCDEDGGGGGKGGRDGCTK